MEPVPPSALRQFAINGSELSHIQPEHISYLQREGAHDPRIKDSESDEDITVEALKRRILKNQLRLRKLWAKMDENHHKFASTSQSIIHSEEHYAKKRKLYHCQGSILKQMIKTLDSCNAQGFVYGIISEEGEILHGASNNLRDWWNDQMNIDHLSGIDTAGRLTQEPLTLNALMKLKDKTLSSLLSTLMLHCNPPQQAYPFEKGVPASWWPNGGETWWSELGVESDQSSTPYKKPRYLKKVEKAGVIIAVLRHMSPNFNKIRTIIRMSKKLQDRMTDKESRVLMGVLKKEEEMHTHNKLDSSIQLGQTPGAFREEEEGDGRRDCNIPMRTGLDFDLNEPFDPCDQENEE